jgi:hypothetical protein
MGGKRKEEEGKESLSCLLYFITYVQGGINMPLAQQCSKTSRR